MGLYESYVGLYESYVGLYESYVGLYDVGLYESYVGLYESYVPQIKRPHNEVLGLMGSGVPVLRVSLFFLLSSQQ